jgi:Pyridoxamine 5'-phosphate oxidase
MHDTRNTEPASGASSGMDVLPEWTTRTIAVLATVDDLPHAIPVSAPVRAGDRLILLSLHRSRGSLSRLRRRPEVALAVLTAGNVAFTARGRARIVQEPMAAAPDYAAVAIDVEQIDDHRQPEFLVEAGVDRRWLDAAARDALGARVHALTGLAS